MSSDAELAERLRKVLNSHGHAFAQAVVKFCYQQQHHLSKWDFVQTEFPYELHGREGHIDFVLQHRESGAMMAAECKRADPATARWCFARTTYTRAGDADRALPVISMLQANPTHNRRVEELPAVWSGGRHAYQLALGLRTDQKGDGIGKDRPDVDAAIAQAYRGASGLIQHLVEVGVASDLPFGVAPVVFTTAELCTTESELADADLLTGNLEAVDISPVSWVWYQMNLSRSLRPAHVHVRASTDPNTLAQIVLYRHTRGVCIVNVGSIPAFLTELRDLRSTLI